jgi:hypothetical protein
LLLAERCRSCDDRECKEAILVEVTDCEEQERNCETDGVEVVDSVPRDCRA